MPNSLVDDWIGYCAGGSQPSDSRVAAWESVDELVRRDPESAWSLVLELIAAAADDRMLANVAAGPLEDLLSGDPDRFIERVEIEARRDPRFRRCLTGAWRIPQRIKDRVAKYTSTVENAL
jgi:hypothetical protein